MADDLAFFQGFRIKGRMQQLVQGFCLDPQHGLFRRDHAFFHQVAGDVDGCFRRTLAVTGLEEIQLAFLNGKFHILHVPVMAFQFMGQTDKFTVAVGHILFQFADRLRGANAGNHIFALGVDQVFPVNAPGAGGRVPGKGHAGTGGVAHVAEHHGLDIHRRAPVAGNIVHAAVYVGTGVIPGAEYRFYRFQQLHGRFLGKILANGFFINRLKAFDQLFHIVDIQVNVELYAFFLFDLIDDFFKSGFGHFHYHVREHLDKTAVRVVGKAGIFSFLRKAFHGNIVQPQIQDGIHHAGHGNTGAAANRYQQGIVIVAENFSVFLFQPAQGLENLPLDLVGNFAAGFIIICARFRCDGKTHRDRQAQIGHLRQVGPFASQQFFHLRVAFMKTVNPFFRCCHVKRLFLIKFSEAGETTFGSV